MTDPSLQHENQFGAGRAGSVTRAYLLKKLSSSVSCVLVALQTVAFKDVITEDAILWVVTPTSEGYEDNCIELLHVHVGRQQDGRRNGDLVLIFVERYPARKP